MSDIANLLAKSAWLGNASESVMNQQRPLFEGSIIVPSLRDSLSNMGEAQRLMRLSLSI
jgi:hypothetical protein